MADCSPRQVLDVCPCVSIIIATVVAADGGRNILLDDDGRLTLDLDCERVASGTVILLNSLFDGFTP